MAKFSDYHTSREVADIMEGIIETHPRIFPGFDLNKMGFVHTQGKKGKKNPIKIKAVRYPHDVWMSQTYIVEVAEDTWKEMGEKKRRLSVFHTMCAVPDGGFDQQSDNYAKIRKPDYEMYAEEFAVSGGVPNWHENDDARDPMEAAELTPTVRPEPKAAAPKKAAKRVPITPSTLVSPKKAAAPAPAEDEDDVAVGGEDESE
jgi:hypothetical protein